ncbi:MAG: DNA polymerase ligase N-terminal domain-containing protein, partial [Alphaproteobacteria bacterium]
MARTSAPKALEKYREKRDFTKTAEPSGEERARGKGAKSKTNGHSFVVQMHAATRLHYDFRLELDGVLKSWAVTRGPSLDPHDKRLAVEVEDHPTEYGGFEGTIPKGEYGGGTVMLWDEGTWEPLEDAHEGLEKGNLKFNLYGERMKGRWVLVRMKPRGKEAYKKNAHNNWLLIKERDGEAREGEAPITETALTSVETGRTMEEIASGTKVWHSNTSVKENVARLEAEDRPPSKAKHGGKMPRFVEPELATLVDEPPEGKNWLHEIKYDGYRAITSVANGKAVIYTRKGLDWTARFGPIGPAVAALPVKSAQLDGEIGVADKNGKTNFSALQAALADGKTSNLTYYAFDLL